MIIQCDSFRTQMQNKQACHQKLQEILDEAEENCKPPQEPTEDQVKKVAGLKNKFGLLKKREKMKLKEKKTSRSLKSNWKDD